MEKHEDSDSMSRGSGSKVLTNLEAEEYVFNAIKGSDNSDIVVLGRFNIF